MLIFFNKLSEVMLILRNTSVSTNVGFFKSVSGLLPWQPNKCSIIEITAKPIKNARKKIIKIKFFKTRLKLTNQPKSIKQRPKPEKSRKSETCSGHLCRTSRESKRLFPDNSIAAPDRSLAQNQTHNHYPNHLKKNGSIN